MDLKSYGSVVLCRSQLGIGQSVKSTFLFTFCLLSVPFAGPKK